MNGFDDDLHASVTPTASFGPSEVAERVARRRGTRRLAAGVGAGILLAIGLASLVTMIGDEDPDVDVANPPTTGSTVAPPADGPVVEDPVGDDGVTGAMSDLHVETDETFGFSQCGADGEPGPPSDERAAELDAVVDGLRGDGLHDQPFVVSSGGPQSVWGVISIGLSSRYEPTLQWIADRVDPADACIEFPEFGVRNLPPELAPVTIEVDPVVGEATVTAEGCAPKGEWVEPFILNRTGAAEVGIAIGRGGLAFTDDCPAPTPRVFELLNKEPVTAAAAPGTVVFGAAAVSGGSAKFSFDPLNAASATTGDDIIAQHTDDPTVQFQVSDIFSDSPVAGAVGEVATDQWPVTGAGTIVVPAGVPAGTYHVRLIANPELNGTLVVGGNPECLPPVDGPQTGWILPDLDGGCVVDVVDAATGAVYVAADDSYSPLLDAAGTPLTVPVDGAMSFACDYDFGLVTRFRDADNDGNAAPAEFDDLVVIEGVGAWSPSVADVLGETPVPERGAGCAQFAKG